MCRDIEREAWQEPGSAMLNNLIWPAPNLDRGRPEALDDG